MAKDTRIEKYVTREQIIEFCESLGLPVNATKPSPLALFVYCMCGKLSLTELAEFTYGELCTDSKLSNVQKAVMKEVIRNKVREMES